jgi:hypothetical protein
MFTKNNEDPLHILILNWRRDSEALKTYAGLQT